MRLVLGLTAAAGILFAVPAFAEDPPAAPAATPAPADPAQTAANQIVCKTMPAETGSRLGARRICMSQSEWDAQTRNNQLEFQRMRDHPGSPNGPGGGG